ncbi:MAG: hypothetical protein O7G88_01800 [bacterium]|nr:hypothetical protein [bacterium]
MDKATLLKSLALLRLTVEKRARRQIMIEILQEEWDSISHFLDDFGKGDCSDLDDISKKKRFFEKEINLIEKEICFILDNINIVALEQYVSGASQDSSLDSKMAETTEIRVEEVVA